MHKALKYCSGLLIFLIAIVAFIGYLHGHNFAIFNPAGEVARKERNLMYLALGLSVIVVVPVFILLFSFAWKYREGGKAKYTPDADGNRILETIWWLIPVVLIGVLSVVTWQSSHELDPTKALVSSKQPLHVQVIALDWKWLFIYPNQHVATVNYLQIPVNTPVEFELTSDAPMNSFWIPQLGGQEYAMSGMSMPLQLIANKMGTYDGSSANISGKGFSGMKFKVHATSDQDFNNWLQGASHAKATLSTASYNKLLKPSENNPPTTYGAVDYGLYDSVVMKYMPTGGSVQ